MHHSAAAYCDDAAGVLLDSHHHKAYPPGQSIVDVQVIEVWVRILQAVPSSRFLLKNKPFACAAAREHVLQLFVKKGIAAHRIDLLPLAVANAGQTPHPPLSLTYTRQYVLGCIDFGTIA